MEEKLFLLKGKRSGCNFGEISTYVVAAEYGQVLDKYKSFAGSKSKLYSPDIVELTEGIDQGFTLDMRLRMYEELLGKDKVIR